MDSIVHVAPDRCEASNRRHKSVLTLGHAFRQRAGVRPVPGYGRAFCAPAAAKDWAMSIGDITAVIMVVCYLTWFGLWLRSNKW
jgi:hypothetical protein